MTGAYIEDNPRTKALRSKFLLLIGINESQDGRSVSKLTDFAIGNGASRREIDSAIDGLEAFLAHPFEAIEFIGDFVDRMLVDVASVEVAPKDKSKLKSQHILSVAIGTNKDRRAIKTLTDLAIETGATREDISANNANFAMLLAHPVEALQLIQEFSEKSLAGEFSNQSDLNSPDLSK